MQEAETKDQAEEAVEFLSRGFVCVPLLPAGRHLDVAALGYATLHLQTRRKDLKEVVFSAIAFELSQHAPDRQTVREWFRQGGRALGLITGHRGLVALDFDDAGAFRAWRAEHPALADAAPLQETPNGIHVFLRCGTPMVSSSLYRGFRKVGHLKALGAYITISALGSDGRPSYRWAHGRSLLDRAPPMVSSLEQTGLRPASPFKRHYDRLLRRGFFESR